MQKWKIALPLLVTMSLAGARAATPTKGADAASPAATGTINLNSASAEQIALLPRVGLKLAERVVEYRKTNGPFKKVEDLMNVSGVGEKSFLKMKPLITVTTKPGQ